ncbi:hypothetical protein IV102_35090 [bacterium]|nr:hypothetical protein [bacterium]
MRHARPFLWAFRLALPLWASSMLVWNTPLFYLSQALLLAGLWMAVASPIGVAGRLAVTVGMGALCARHFLLLPPTSPALTQGSSFMLANLHSNQDILVKLLLDAARWFVSWKQWVPMTLPVLALVYAASRLARQLDDRSLSRSLLLLTLFPGCIYLGAMLGMALALVAGLVMRVGGIALIGPLVALAWIHWLLKLSLELHQLTRKVPAGASWLLPLLSLPVMMLVLFAPRWLPSQARPSTRARGDHMSTEELQRKFRCKVTRVEWLRVDGRAAVELGHMEFSSDSGSYGIQQAVRDELKRHAGKVRAGQVWVFYSAEGKSLADGVLTARDPFQCYNDTVLSGGRLNTQDFRNGLRPNSLAAAVGQQLVDRLETGRCLAWERTVEPPVSISLWVQWREKPNPRQLLRRCQLEAFKYASSQLHSVRLHAGTGSSAKDWLPDRSVTYTWDNRVGQPRYADPQDCARWSLANCPSAALTSQLLLKHDFYARRPPPRKSISKDSVALCQARQALLMQALKQYHRDHQGRWPSSIWGVVPAYLNLLPACPQNESCDYDYTVEEERDSCRLNCFNSHLMLTEHQGAYTESLQFTGSTSESAPELEECLKHPIGWLKQFETNTGMVP